MKSLFVGSSIVFALLLSSTSQSAQAVRLTQKTFNNLSNHDNDEIDPDEIDVTDGQVKNEGDLVVY